MPERRWELAVALDRAGGTPVFLQIAGSLSDDIRRGRLRPGQALPGTRRLAATLGVNRNTVVAAYEELQAEGWIETDAARASRVSSALPDPRPQRFTGAGRRAAVPARTGYDLPPLPALPHRRHAAARGARLRQRRARPAARAGGGAGARVSPRAAAARPRPARLRGPRGPAPPARARSPRCSRPRAASPRGRTTS